MMETIISIFFGVITPAVMQWLKTEPWAIVINRGHPFFNAVIAAAIAVGNVVGVQWAFSGGTLTVTGLDIPQMAHMGVTFTLTWVAQELIYRFRVKPS